MKVKAISVIIPFYGSVDDLEKCLDGLTDQDFTGSFEIIVIESTADPAVSRIINQIPNALLISSAEVLSPGRARNLGVKKSEASLLAFIDADCIPERNWLSEIYLTLQKYEIVIGPVLNQYPFHPVASVDNLLQFVDFQKYRNSEITHFPACNMGLTKEIFQKTSGFPEDLITGEDVIFSESAIKFADGNLIYKKNIIVRHAGRRKYSQFVKHNEVLGFYRGYFSLKIKNVYNPELNLFIYSVYFVLKRLVYITIRTVQWNPVGVLRIIIYFPLFIAGLFNWGIGFYNGNKKCLLNENSLIADWHKGYK